MREIDTGLFRAVGEPRASRLVGRHFRGGRLRGAGYCDSQGDRRGPSKALHSPIVAHRKGPAKIHRALGILNSEFRIPNSELQVLFYFLNTSSSCRSPSDEGVTSLTRWSMP